MGVVLRVPLRPHLIDAPRAQTVFLEEDDHRHEERVASSRMRFQKLSGGREDEDVLMGELEQLLALVKQNEMELADNDSNLEALENKINSLDLKRCSQALMSSMTNCNLSLHK
ncbi:hypothetical protein JHK84_049864 [Glycine max]|nr:hypothetical protein JHK84_049864 [Glycine max]